MNRVTKRTWLMGLFLAVLIGGMSFFLWEYWTQAGTWASSSASPHLYNKGNIGCGIIVDRNGDVLLDMNGERTYSSLELTRMSTLHWLGDRNGYIRAGAVSNYVQSLVGYDRVNGVYRNEGVGGEIQLTISQRVQNKAFAALGDRKGTVAVYNYKTGEVLCAVTSPAYDPDDVPDFSADDSGYYEGVYLNRFLQSAYTPGSIFKVVTTAAALECVPDIETKYFQCTGEYSYGTEAVTCETAHGTLNLQWALANSCNCCFAQIAELVGRKNMEKYVRQFEVIQPISFDGVSSVAGNYSTAGTGGASFAWSCIGQHTDLINPCRYMTFMGQIASGGTGAMPHIVAEVRADGEPTYVSETTDAGRIMNAQTAKKLQTFMRNNVESIYGSWNFPGMTVCGKSGTSQLGGGLRSNAMFAGFVLDEQYPLAFIAVVENGGYGAAACVPILSSVLSECRIMMDAQ